MKGNCAPGILPVLICAIVLTACQSSPRLASTDRILLPGSDCEAAIGDLMKAIDSAGTHNPAYQHIEGWAPLRSNRFLASFQGQVTDRPSVSAWFERVKQFSIEALVVENSNLPIPVDQTGIEFVASCITALTDQNTNLTRLLNESPLARSSYSDWQPVLGLRPLLRPIYAYTTRSLHEREREAFLAPVAFAADTVYLPGVQFPALTRDEISRLFDQAYGAGTLGIPAFQPRFMELLLRQYSPGFRIEYGGENDLIGRPVGVPGQWSVDDNYPIVYTLPSLTRFDGRVLLQLNYVVWFSGRMADSPLDIYAGDMDSIIWRVTLDPQGNVLLYDSIHSCGCYHKYYVVDERLTIRQPPLSSEPASILDATHLNAHEPVLIDVNANHHYIVGARNLNSIEADSPYAMDDYRNLYRPGPGRSTSLFDSRGLVDGSQRLERYVLWPAGVVSTGAMRQWGTHATGFVEEQHFDDPFLLEHYFEISTSSSLTVP